MDADTYDLEESYKAQLKRIELAISSNQFQIKCFQDVLRHEEENKARLERRYNEYKNFKNIKKDQNSRD